MDVNILNESMVTDHGGVKENMSTDVETLRREENLKYQELLVLFSKIERFDYTETIDDRLRKYVQTIIKIGEVVQAVISLTRIDRIENKEV